MELAIGGETARRSVIQGIGLKVGRTISEYSDAYIQSCKELKTRKYVAKRARFH